MKVSFETRVTILKYFHAGQSALRVGRLSLKSFRGASRVGMNLLTDRFSEARGPQLTGHWLRSLAEKLGIIMQAQNVA